MCKLRFVPSEPFQWVDANFCVFITQLSDRPKIWLTIRAQPKPFSRTWCQLHKLALVFQYSGEISLAANNTFSNVTNGVTEVTGSQRHGEDKVTKLARCARHSTEELLGTVWRGLHDLLTLKNCTENS